MKIRNTLVTVLAAATIVSCATGRTQVASDPDTNLDPSTSATEAELPPTSASEARVAKDPDPDEGLSTAGEEARLPPTPPREAQRAEDPDPNVAPSTTDNDDKVESTGSSARVGN